MKKRKLWDELALWEECRTRAAKLGLEIGVDTWEEYPLSIGLSERDSDGGLVSMGRFERSTELRDWIEGYESAQMHREAE